MREDPLVGQDLGGFRIDALLRRGGMGRIYRAKQRSVGGRTVALKVLAPELAEDEDFRSRFLHEARLAGSIDHPNILPVHDAGEADGRLFIAMRLVEGPEPDLGSLLRRIGPLSLEQTVRIIEQTAAALDAAHQQGLVHRDVKPGNLLLAEEHVYLTDFGVAKPVLARRELTRTGVFIGTLDYAAPEQIRNEPLDGRADLYALGCVLYQCLTGRVPFDRSSEFAVMQAHLVDLPPRPSDHRPDLPVAFDSVIAVALAKARDERYRTGRHLVDATRAACAGGPVPTPTVAASFRPERASLSPTVNSFSEARPDDAAAVRSRWVWALLLGLAALAVVGGVSVAGFGAGQREQPSPSGGAALVTTEQKMPDASVAQSGATAPAQAPSSPAPSLTPSPSVTPSATPLVTQPPSPQSTVRATLVATPNPGPDRTMAPVVPSSGLVISGTVTDIDTGAPINQACVTLGPPITCFTTTDSMGRYVINLSELSAKPGGLWDLYFLKSGQFAQAYSGVFVVNGPVVKNAQLRRLRSEPARTVTPPVAVPISSGFDSAYAGESAFLTLGRGQVGTFTVFFANTGTVTWQKGTSTQVNLVACLEDKVTCNAQDATEAAFNAGWPSGVTYATHTQSFVLPGQIGTFTFNVAVPLTAASGLHRFNGALVVASTGRDIHNEGYYQDVRVP